MDKGMSKKFLEPNNIATAHRLEKTAWRPPHSNPSPTVGKG